MDFSPLVRSAFNLLFKLKRTRKGKKRELLYASSSSEKQQQQKTLQGADKRTVD